MLNYAGSYHDVSFTPAREVPAWVTLDAALHYDLGGLGGYLKGTRAIADSDQSAVMQGRHS